MQIWSLAFLGIITFPCFTGSFFPRVERRSYVDYESGGVRAAVQALGINVRQDVADVIRRLVSWSSRYLGR